MRPLMDGIGEDDDLEMKGDDIEIGLIHSSTENPMHDLVDNFSTPK